MLPSGLRAHPQALGIATKSYLGLALDCKNTLRCHELAGARANPEQVCVCIQTYMNICLHIFLYIYIYILYIYVVTYVHTYIYIYIYMYI